MVVVVETAFFVVVVVADYLNQRRTNIYRRIPTTTWYPPEPVLELLPSSAIRAAFELWFPDAGSIERYACLYEISGWSPSVAQQILDEAAAGQMTFTEAQVRNYSNTVADLAELLEIGISSKLHGHYRASLRVASRQSPGPESW